MLEQAIKDNDMGRFKKIVLIPVQANAAQKTYDNDRSKMDNIQYFSVSLRKKSRLENSPEL